MKDELAAARTTIVLKLNACRRDGDDSPQAALNDLEDLVGARKAWDAAYLRQVLTESMHLGYDEAELETAAFDAASE